MKFQLTRTTLTNAFSIACAASLLACGSAQPAPCSATTSTGDAPPAAPEPAPAVTPASVPRLSLWQDGNTRKAIEDFVKKVSTEGGPEFVPEKERIAVFDNDGTLWSEQPIYVQLAFALDRIKELAPSHPEWRKKPAFKAVLDGDMKALTEEGLLELVMATHSGTSAEEFEAIAEKWLQTALHPKYQRPYTELTFAPMVELLEYLRAHQFKTFIVSGGGVAFMRPVTEKIYGIPPEQVVGSRIKSSYLDGKIQREAELEFLDDGPSKPVGIYEMIGRHPILAAGNSDGDLAMLEWTLKKPGSHLALLVHHTDDERETAYDRESHIGKLDKALDAATAEGAAAQGWVVIDMKNDWKQVFTKLP